MSAPTIVKATDARDFLSVVPSLAGYTPVESVVLIPFKDHRTIGLMRFDLPTSYAIGELATFASTVIGLVCRLNEADAVAAVVYSTERDSAAVRPVLLSLVPLTQICGLDIVDLMYVTSDGWGKATSDDPPRPLEELALERPDVSAPEAESQRSSSALPVVDEELAAATLLAIGDVPDEVEPELLLAVIEQTCTEDATAGQLAVLHWCLERPALRDIILLGWTVGQDGAVAGMQAQADWDEGAEYPVELAQMMWGEGVQPDAHRLKRALHNVRILAAILPLPGAFATAAWLAWALGKSTEANSYVQRGLAIDDEHGLCGIVSSFITAGHLPDWAFHRPGE